MSSTASESDSPLTTFRFHWKDGHPSIDYKGTDARDALTRNGFGQGVMVGLDYWEPLDT
ncbi:hypothetical protein O4214_30015 [Rhodococcus erythropolis]|uniref:hypothetical protein n=1 Tax=Rhodococcus erythropolis TaxID=1833 RepID=UPI001E3FDE5D|nr:MULTISPECIES: hypothetical protein [Rhodococcus erythropolis group]MCD2109302.1 hypothetical protein [Rhodococcus qingshengii]MCZ4528226.1 hypothetical protein [Rhodococcus erythropolis]